MEWSVVLEAAGDRVLEREEIVELADAVAPLRGIASGIGATSYGAQIVVAAETREDAQRLGVAALEEAARQAGLPPWPVSCTSALSEAEDAELEP